MCHVADERAMDNAEYTILAVNLIFAFGFGWPLARRLSEALGGARGRHRFFLLLIFVYFLESIAFSASMGTNILGILLALLWGMLLSRRLRCSRNDAAESRRIALLFSCYTTLPAVSLLSVPLAMALRGWSILSQWHGLRFGVPGFLPWPLSTILSFCAAVALVAVICKVTITTGMVRLMTGRKEEVA
jgi:hypothetical protein